MTKKHQKPQLDIVFKEEHKKNEIRKVNAYPYYHDGRIEKFMDLFNELFANCMKYSKSKGNTWEYVYCKILQVLGIEYVFIHPKEEEPESVPPSDANKEGEKKEEKKEGEAAEGENKEEKKEGENENKKEEEKKDENEKKEENKEEEKKEVEDEKKEEKKEEKNEESNKQIKNEEEKNAN